MTLHRRTDLMLALMALLLAAGAATAQSSSGQLWVRLYQDLDADGQRDAGEPLLTRGAAVALSDSTGAIIATALLDESPNAAQGLIGFQGLQPGRYVTVVTSADFAPTTDATFTRDISGDGVPIVIELGTQPILDATPALANIRGLFGLPIYLGERTQVARVALGILGACIVAGFMTLLGCLAYWIVVRRNRPEAPPPAPPTSTRLPVVPG